MNLDQLMKTAQQHRGPLLAAGAAGAVGLGLYSRKKAGGDVSGSPAAARTAASAGSQAGLTTGSGGVYDSTVNDLYSALQPQLENIIRNTTPGAPGAAPAPPVPVPAQPKIASTLLNPTGSGKYVRGSNGLIAEVESDGSLLGLNGGQWASLAKTLGGRAQVTQLRGTLAGLPVFDTERNLRTMNAPAKPPTPVPAAAAPASAPAPAPASSAPIRTGGPGRFLQRPASA